jgi:hypothetical protein
MQRAQLRLAILITVGVLLLGACNSFKLFERTDDKAITASIQAKLFSDPILKTRDVRVDSQGGVVTVSGTVGTDLERAAVERIATQEDGVKNVINMLSVSSQSATPLSQSVQSAASAAQPQVVPPPAPQEQMATEKPRRAHHARTASGEDKASAELHAYTDSLAPNPAASPAPAPAAAPAPPAPAPVAAEPVPAPPPAPKPPERITIPAGTVVTVRMIDNIDSSRNRSGEEFAASLDSPIVVGDRVLASRGAEARVRLVDAKSAGHITGQSELQLELIAVTINGVPYSTHSGYYAQHGASRGTQSAERVGGGAVVGALIGGILGRGKGAAIGSAVGAGAGTAVQVSTQGQHVKVPAEAKLDFTLKDPVVVTVAGSK